MTDTQELLLNRLRKENTDCLRKMRVMQDTTEQELRKLSDGGEAWFRHMELASEIEGSLDEQTEIIESLWKGLEEE